MAALDTARVWEGHSLFSSIGGWVTRSPEAFPRGRFLWGFVPPSALQLELYTLPRHAQAHIANPYG